jgi:hypothetical protein
MTREEAVHQAQGVLPQFGIDPGPLQQAELASDPMKIEGMVNMKRLRITLLTVLGLVFTVMPWNAATPASATGTPPDPPSLMIQINGVEVVAPAYTTVVAGQLMLPLRWTAEQLGVQTVQWDSEKRQVSIETDEDFYHLAKYESFRSALESQYVPPDEQILPLPARAEQIVLPPLRRDQTFAEYDALLQRANINTASPYFLITLANKSKSYMDAEAVYIFENHDGHIYVPTVLLEDLFYARFDYDASANRLSIKTPDLDEVKQQLAKMDDVLTPVSPEEAKNLWGRGEQTRNGALQYTALSPSLRQQADKSMASGSYSSWVTGGSSPWVGPITVQEEKKLSDTETEFTVTYPEMTSAPPNPTATEKFVVTKLAVNGKEGWFITEWSDVGGYGSCLGLQ